MHPLVNGADSLQVTHYLEEVFSIQVLLSCVEVIGSFSKGTIYFPTTKKAVLLSMRQIFFPKLSLSCRSPVLPCLLITRLRFLMILVFTASHLNRFDQSMLPSKLWAKSDRLEGHWKILFGPVRLESIVPGEIELLWSTYQRIRGSPWDRISLDTFLTQLFLCECGESSEK